MGKKKQQHAAQSFGNMVNKAAVAQLLPQINQIINGNMQQLAQRLVIQQVNTFNMLTLRIVALEKLLIEKTLLTQDDLIAKVTDLEDEQEGLTVVEDLQAGDTARIGVRVKQPNETDFSKNNSKLKVSNVGTGNTLGKEIEDKILGMKLGEVRQVEASKEGAVVEITLNRSSRPAKQEAPAAAAAPQEATNDQVQEQ